MIPYLVVIAFGLVVVGTGPSYHQWRARRREERDRPLARVVYLPSASCRAPEACPDPAHCAICISRAAALSVA
jgi:hypothetical protein